jgi:hypothetical protein
MACDEEQQAVDDLNLGIQSLQAALQDAGPATSPGLIAKIDSLQTQLKYAQRELDDCLSGKRLRSTFQASVLLRTTHELAHGPTPFEDIAIKFLFEGDNHNVVRTLAWSSTYQGQARTSRHSAPLDSPPNSSTQRRAF